MTDKVCRACDGRVPGDHTGDVCPRCGEQKGFHIAKEVSDTLTPDISFTLSVKEYPEALLEMARKLNADGYPQQAVITAQMALELEMEYVFAALFRFRKIEYLDKIIRRRHNLADKPVRKLYVALSGDRIHTHDPKFWNSFTAHAKRRHEIVHGGRQATQEEAGLSVGVVERVRTHLRDVLRKLTPPTTETKP